MKFEEACKILKVSPMIFFDLQEEPDPKKDFRSSKEYIELLEENRNLRIKLEKLK